MELMKGGNGKAHNLAVKQLKCECGCNTFVLYPIGLVAYNALNPQQAEPQVFGYEFKCKNCGAFQCLSNMPDALPKWVTKTQEEKEEIDRAAFQANQEKEG